MADTLLVGACKTDITPTDLSQVYLAGFGNNRKATRVVDPLFARALYLSDGREEFALVVLDLIGVQGPLNRRLRESAGDPPAARTWVACTHTHSGPDTLGLWGKALFPGLPVTSGIDQRYVSMLAGEVGNAVRRARRLARPAYLSLATDASDKSDITWNVRDANWSDHELHTLVFRHARTGAVIATLTNYGSHPEALWSSNTGVSPDWPAAMHKSIERETGGVSIFVNGALGAMVTPALDEKTRLSERLDFYQSHGRKVASLALAAMREARPSRAHDLRVAEKPLMIPLDNGELKFIAALGVLDRPHDYRGTETSIGLARIGDAHLIGAPGEVCPELGLALKKTLGRSPTLLASLCNDELGYLMPAPYFDGDNYQYEKTVSPGPRTAEFLLGGLRELTYLIDEGL